MPAPGTKSRELIIPARNYLSDPSEGAKVDPQDIDPRRSANNPGLRSGFSPPSNEVLERDTGKERAPSSRPEGTPRIPTLLVSPVWFCCPASERTHRPLIRKAAYVRRQKQARTPKNSTNHALPLGPAFASLGIGFLSV